MRVHFAALIVSMLKCGMRSEAEELWYCAVDAGVVEVEEELDELEEDVPELDTEEEVEV